MTLELHPAVTLSCLTSANNHTTLGSVEVVGDKKVVV